MDADQTTPPAPERPLRLWPGVLLVALQLLLRLVGPLLSPEARMYAFMAGLLLALGVMIWWLFFSRARWFDRIGVLLVMVVALVATKTVVHPSVAGGMMGMLLFVYAIPILGMALVGAVVASRRLSSGLRRGAIAAGIVLV